MSEHFLLSAKARTLSLASVLRMTDEEAETVFRSVRWPTMARQSARTANAQRSMSAAARMARSGSAARRAARTSPSHLAPCLPSTNCRCGHYLAATAIFVNEVKGKSALALSRDLDVQYKTAFVLAHKLREAMASELKGMRLGGDGETVEVDGGYFGGYVKPANHKENRRDLRLARNQTGKRKVVVVMRERGGRTVPAVFKSESAALGYIIARVAPRRS